ncbi:MAG: TrkA family potassium uptake protein, partial [Actinomycetales bacterium]|nr:TrkA family potassium uptake protein [Actinomycetales bacterium]
VAVIGLGRFGSALAQELMEQGREVLGIDSDESLVQDHANLLTQTVRADCTSEVALNELGITDFDAVVVAIGSDIESSILSCSILIGLGVEDLWAKSTSVAHGRILKQLGVKHVVFPESDMGKRIAHQVGGDQLDYVEIDEKFVMAKTRVSDRFEGKTLAELAFRKTHGIIVVATSHEHLDYLPATPETILQSGDELIIAGPKEQIELFCRG